MRGREERGEVVRVTRMRCRKIERKCLCQVVWGSEGNGGEGRGRSSVGWGRKGRGEVVSKLLSRYHH